MLTLNQILKKKKGDSSKNIHTHLSEGTQKMPGEENGILLLVYRLGKKVEVRPSPPEHTVLFLSFLENSVHL